MNKGPSRRHRPEFLALRALILALISHWRRSNPNVGRRRSVAYRLIIPVLVVSLFLLPSAPATAQQSPDLGDVLDDIKTAEEMKDFIKDPGGYTKGKLKGEATKYIKNAAFGPSLTGQMQQVLNKTYTAFDALPDKGGVCPAAAQSHAWGVLFDMYTMGVPGAFGRIAADLVLKIPSAPKMAADLGKEALKMAKEQAEKYLRDQLAPTPETYSKKSSKGPCTYAIVAVIDYAAGRYDVVIVADCKCQPLRIKGRPAAVAGWAVRASGKATPTLDDNFVKARIGSASAKFTADCACGGEGGGGGLQLCGGGSSSGLQTAGGAEDEDPCKGVDCNAVIQGIAETERSLEKIRKAMKLLPDGNADKKRLGVHLSTLTADIQGRIQTQQECCNNVDPSGLPPELLYFYKLALPRFHYGEYHPPKDETKEETDDRGSRADPPADTSEGEYVRGEPTMPPDGSQVLTTEVAFAGGSIVGMVVSPQDTSVAGASFEVGTISGVVVEDQTKEDGSFTARVPAGATGMLRVTVAGIAEVITMNIVTAVPKNIPSMPPSLVEPGTVVDVIGNYPRVELEQPAQPGQPMQPSEPVQPAETAQPALPSEPGQPVQQAETRVPMEPGQALEQYGRTPIPTARSLGPGGVPAITRYRIPQTLAPGPLTTVLTDPSGVATRVQTGIFKIVTARIDQDKLTSGENAEFRYQFDFGPGPERQHWITINTSGPIEYKGEGQRRALEVDEEGHAEFGGNVKATKSTPGGKPFNISVTIERR